VEQVGRANADEDRKRDAPVHRGDQIAPPALAKIRKADGDDQKRFQTFTKGDDKSLKHWMRPM
jgi:hypothetical protein